MLVQGISFYRNDSTFGRAQEAAAPWRLVTPAQPSSMASGELASAVMVGKVVVQRKAPVLLPPDLLYKASDTQGSAPAEKVTTSVTMLAATMATQQKRPRLT